MSGVSPCPGCGGNTLYRGPETSAGGGHAPNYLPGLGSFLRAARFTLVVCRDCGLTRFFAAPEARVKLKESSKWKSL
jgi:predicted nucleic-acid-binding Zn-ribbon protein